MLYLSGLQKRINFKIRVMASCIILCEYILYTYIGVITVLNCICFDYYAGCKRTLSLYFHRIYILLSIIYLYC